MREIGPPAGLKSGLGRRKMTAKGSEERTHVYSYKLTSHLQNKPIRNVAVDGQAVRKTGNQLCLNNTLKSVN
jgi:hypothetical protein